MLYAGERQKPRAPVRRRERLPYASTMTAAVSGKPGCACGGGCPRCRAQTGAPASDAHERYERQADRVAEQVVNGKPLSAPLPIDAAAHGTQTKGNAERASGGAHAERRIAQDLGGGRPLPDATRGFMEERFGADFGAVRVHTGARAVRLNTEIEARAFTFGSDIWLGAHESVNDRRLMAHELTHVLQQRAGGAYIARQPQSGTGQGSGTGTTTSVSGCDRKTTGVDDAPDTLLSARAIALGAVQKARTAFKPLKSSTVTLLDQHFHCPSTMQILQVMKTLAAIENLLPTLPVTCLGATDPDCAGDNLGQALDTKPDKPGGPRKPPGLHACPPYFGKDVGDVFRAVTFIFAAAAGAGPSDRCRRGEACYDDFQRSADAMLENPYSYAWFAVEAAGLSAPQPMDTDPCRPIEVGIYVNVPPAAKKDPSQIRRVSGFDTPPAGSEIASVWVDAGGKYFIYHDDIPGARTYLPGEPKKRYYFPDGSRP